MQKIGAITKPAEAFLRAAALARGGDDRLRLSRRTSPGKPDGVVVLQQGPNASTDYYLRPRLERLTELPWTIQDLTADPEEVALFAEAGRQPWIVLCRYVNGRWLRVLERNWSRIARLSLLIDDDMRLMRRDRSLPLSTRGKVALGHSVFAGRLAPLLNDLWVSTPVLQARYPGSQRLEPLTDGEPASPAPAENRLVAHHASDAHATERAFVLEVARRVADLGGDAQFEFAGDARMMKSAAGASNITIVPQISWPRFRAAQEGRSAAIFLAPLADTPLNRARSPIKVFDAARLGAVGLFSDLGVYGDAVRDGVNGRLLPWDVEAWAAAIMDLLANPDRRIALTEAMRVRMSASHAAITAAPFQAARL